MRFIVRCCSKPKDKALPRLSNLPNRSSISRGQFSISCSRFELSALRFNCRHLRVARAADYIITTRFLLDSNWVSWRLGHAPCEWRCLQMEIDWLTSYSKQQIYCNIYSLLCKATHANRCTPTFHYHNDHHHHQVDCIEADAAIKLKMIFGPRISLVGNCPLPIATAAATAAIRIANRGRYTQVHVAGMPAHVISSRCVV